MARRERELAALAKRQHGVITRRQLLDAGLGVRTIARRIEAGRLHRLHREVYAYGSDRVSQRGHWLAAVRACGDGALLSHRSAASLWGLMRPPRGPVEVSSASGRGRSGIAVHEGGIHRDDRAVVAGIPVTSVARTLFDLSEVEERMRFEKAFEEADRLRLLELSALEAVCARGHGRRALKIVRGLIEEARMPEMAGTPLEQRVLDLCRDYDIQCPATNVVVLGKEVDAYWPDARLMVEADGWAFHHHQAAFERDRERDAAMQAEGYRVIRLTHRRLTRESEVVAEQLRRLLALGGVRAGS